MSGQFLTNGRWSSEPLAYVFQADIYCPDCLTEVLISAGIASPGARGMATIDAVEQIAAASAIDFDDEYSYDSDDFPKLVTEADEETRCGSCNRTLSDD